MHEGTLARPLRAVVAAAAVLLASVLTTGAASAAPPAPPAPPGAAPPGPVTGLVLTGSGGQGARTAYTDARWAAPTAPGDGTGLHYVYEVVDATGQRVDGGTTTEPAAGTFRADRCTQPYTVTVTALTRDPATGGTLGGPPATASYGRTTCAIDSSLTATQTAPGTLRVDIAREQPVDPYVAGPCVLTVGGREAWTGTCGGNDPETAVVTGLPPGTHALRLTTTAPDGTQYVATASAAVS